ncbi:MAG: BglG family transcription antiterminator [Fusobacteriaceae bacterium]
MVINTRIISILEILLDNSKEKNFKSLSKILKVNERTIRYDIDIINKTFLEKNIPIIENIGKGNLYLKEPEKVLVFLKKLSNVNFVNEYREAIILIKILFQDLININQFCEELDLSRTTIKETLKELKKILEVYNLKLEIVPKQGLKLIGEEEDIRRLQLKTLNQYMVTETQDYIKNFFYEEICAYYKDIDIKKIKKFIFHVTKEINKIISDEALITLSNYILIMIKRIEKKQMVIFSQNQNFFSETKEYEVLKKALPFLEADFEIKLNDFELYKLTDYFLGSHSYVIDQSFYSNWIEIEILIKKIINNFEKIYGQKLHNDKLLLDGLVNHIKPAIYRVKNKIELQNSVYQEFYLNYSTIYETTKLALLPLTKFIGEEISEEEISFISLHFKASLDRNKTDRKESKNILIVCGSGYGTSKLLAQQIQDRYNVNIVDTIPYNQFNSQILENVDLIITTLYQEKLDTTIPVVSIKTILTEENISVLNKYNLPRYSKKVSLNSLVEIISKSSLIKDKKTLVRDLKSLMRNKLILDFENRAPALSELLKIENIKLNISSNNWEDAILLAGNILEGEGAVSNEYIHEIIEKIKKYGSYMVGAGNLALPHGKGGDSVFKTSMVLFTFSEPIIFPGQEKINTMLTFSSLDNSEHLDALTTFIDLVKEHDFLEKIKTIKSEKKIQDIIIKYEFLVGIGKKKKNYN